MNCVQVLFLIHTRCAIIQHDIPAKCPGNRVDFIEDMPKTSGHKTNAIEILVQRLAFECIPRVAAEELGNLGHLIVGLGNIQLMAIFLFEGCHFTLVLEQVAAVNQTWRECVIRQSIGFTTPLAAGG